MDKFQAAFEILYLLSAVDGEVDINEVEIIKNFLQLNYGSISFDPSEVIGSIDTLTPQGKLEEFGTAASVFKGSSGAQDRTVFLDFAVRLIVADGNISEEEGQMFGFLADSWNVDIARFLAK